MVATYDNVIEQIVQSVFSTMAQHRDVPVLRRHVARLRPAVGDRSHCRHLDRERGSCHVGTSCHEATADMLHMDPADVTAADQQDVASELVNMIGGNLKSMLPGPSFLSLPTIVSGHEFGLQVHDAELLDDVVLACGAGLRNASLHEGSDRIAVC